MTRYLLKAFNFLLLIGSFHACTQNSPLEQALKESVYNRNELEKVIELYSRYPGDSLKLRAACFLIENMKYHHSIKDNEDYRNLAFSIDCIFNTVMPAENYKLKTDSILCRSFVQFNNDNLIKDLNTIPAHLLITNIEESFAQADLTEISFNDFCEYILPYRIGLEPLENWKTIFRTKLTNELDSLGLSGSPPYELCEYLTHRYIYNNYEPECLSLVLPPSGLLNLKAGNCVNYSHLGAFLGRSFGIPVGIDFIPQWASKNGWHQWDALVYPNEKKAIPFMIGDYPPFGTHLERAESKGNAKASKIYRRTFSSQSESLPMQDISEDIPFFFQDPCFKDVTDWYLKTVDITLEPSYPNTYDKKVIYLMTFNNKTWIPVDWSTMQTDKEISFQNIAPDNMYIAGWFHNRTFVYATSPFTVDASGKIKKYGIINNSSNQQVVLKRKYFDRIVNSRLQEITHDKLQVSNDIHFKNAKDIHIIDTVRDALFDTIKIDTQNRKYKYFRYYCSENSLGNVAELELYNTDGKKIQGEVIAQNNANPDIHKVFDGDVLSYFSADDSCRWVGLAFHQPEMIGKIIYLPRNDDNFIRVGQKYELMYWDNGWNSMGIQEGNYSQQLVYNDVPANALLLLHNHSSGTEERIFTYEDGKQIWW